MEDHAMPPDIAQRRQAIEELCRRFHVARLEVFGSVATGEDRPGESDIDFLVEFETGLPSGAYADAYFGLIEALEKLFDRHVDLVTDSAIKNPYFRESVEQTKRPVYAA